jgi:hypothetical protein
MNVSLQKIFNYLQSNWLLLAGILIFFILAVAIIFLITKKESKVKDGVDNNILVCPIRGILKRTKYAANGKYSEEYYTIKLVQFLLRRGYQKEQIGFEHTIRIGRDGHNSLRVDLTVKREGKFVIVAEVKNNSREIESAIKHQLLPAMGILNARHGIYFDGSTKSLIYTRNKDGVLTSRTFP